jgi:membrane protein DedA with SNARE-associated domain
VEYVIDLLLDFYGPMPYALVFLVLMACGFGVPIPEDVILIAAGVLAYYGVSDVYLMIVVGFCGVMIGDSTMFLLGAKYGRKLTKVWLFHKLLPDERLDAVQKILNERGTKLLFAARFMPGLRSPIFFSAGTLHVPFRKFFLYDGAAALLSVPLIVGAVYYWGDAFDKVVTYIKRVEHGILFVIFAIIAFAVFKWWWGKRRKKQQSMSV